MEMKFVNVVSVAMMDKEIIQNNKIIDTRDINYSKKLEKMN